MHGASVSPFSIQILVRFFVFLYVVASCFVLLLWIGVSVTGLTNQTNNHPPGWCRIRTRLGTSITTRGLGWLLSNSWREFVFVCLFVSRDTKKRVPAIRSGRPSFCFSVAFWCIRVLVAVATSATKEFYFLFVLFLAGCFVSLSFCIVALFG